MNYIFIWRGFLKFISNSLSVKNTFFPPLIESPEYQVESIISYMYHIYLVISLSCLPMFHATFDKILVLQKIILFYLYL